MDVIQGLHLEGSQSGSNPNDFKLILISFDYAQDQIGTQGGVDLKEDWADADLRGRRADSQIKFQMKTRVEAEESILEEVHSSAGSVERSG